MPPGYICVTYGDDPMENYIIVVPTSRQFSKVPASLVPCKVECVKLAQKWGERTRGAWSQYNSSLMSPMFVSRVTDSILADAVVEVETDRESTGIAAKILLTKS